MCASASKFQKGPKWSHIARWSIEESLGMKAVSDHAEAAKPPPSLPFRHGNNLIIAVAATIRAKIV